MSSGIVRIDSASGRSLRIYIERIDALGCRHEQAVAVGAAEAEVGTALGQVDAADQFAIRVVDVYAVQRRVSHPPAHPEIAVNVAAHPVRRARSHVDELALVG